MLHTRYDIDERRMSIASEGANRPAASNDTAEGRAENRRVDLVVSPRTKVNFAGPGAAAPVGEWRKITDGD